jgi:AcrR family transcriptional regulator
MEQLFISPSREGKSAYATLRVVVADRAPALATESVTRRQRGRQPSPATAKAILDATRELLAAGGVQRLTVENVAARTGIAKTTIYRRWRSKEELALAVLIAMVEEQAASVSDRGDARAELITFVAQAIEILRSTLMGRVMQGLVSELAANPELAQAFRERVVARRVEELTRILERGIERGDIRADADIGMANELLFGPVYYRLFLSGKPLDKNLAETLVDAFLAWVGGAPKDPPPA